MENSINDRWLEIVGFPNYRMNPDTLEVKNVLRDRVLKINRSKQFVLRRNCTPYSITLPRLLFSVQNGILFTEVSSNIFIVMENSKPVVYNMNEYLHKKKIECKRRQIMDVNPLQTY